MLPTDICKNPILNTIKAFVCGDMTITEFMGIYAQSNNIAGYFDSIIDHIEKHNIPIQRRTVLIKNVNQNQPFEQRSYVERFIKEHAKSFRDLSERWKESPPKVSSYLNKLSPVTAAGAYEIHNIVSDIYYQIDSVSERTAKYHDEFVFSLDVLPGYLAGGISAENYVSQYILSKYPTSMKKGERKRLVKEDIKTAFPRDCKGYPRWIQMPEWPIGSNEKPMAYIGQKAFEHYSEYYFRDTETNERTTVKQWC